MNPTNQKPDQTAPTTETPEEVKKMAFKRTLRKRTVSKRAVSKRAVSAEEVRRAWDSLSETDRNVMLTSARKGYRSRVSHDEAVAATFRRLS